MSLPTLDYRRVRLSSGFRSVSSFHLLALMKPNSILIPTSGRGSHSTKDRGHQPTAWEHTRPSVQWPKSNEPFQQSLSDLRRWSCLQQTWRDCSLVSTACCLARPRPENPLNSCPDFWCTETADINGFR